MPKHVVSGGGLLRAGGLEFVVTRAVVQTTSHQMDGMVSGFNDARWSLEVDMPDTSQLGNIVLDGSPVEVRQRFGDQVMTAQLYVTAGSIDCGIGGLGLCHIEAVQAGAPTFQPIGVALPVQQPPKLRAKVKPKAVPEGPPLRRRPRAMLLE